MKKYVIIGGGPAGATAAETIRKLDGDGDVTVVTDEGYPFYRREHIAYLISGDESEEELFEKGRDFYSRIKAKSIIAHVTQISDKKNQVKLDNSSTINYDYLLISSGGKPIPLSFPGIELEGVSTLYSLDDAKKVSKLAKETRNAVVIGGGTTAMRVAPILRKIDKKVSLIEKADRLWPTMFDKRASEIVEKRLREDGAEILLNEEVSEFKGRSGKIQSVILKTGRTLPCDLVLLTVGIRPNIEFLKGSAIEVDRGVLVDNHLRTTVPNIYAAGDVAQVPDPLFQKPVLHQTWSYAEEQGEIAAYNMAGSNRAYEGAVNLFSMSVIDLDVVASGITQPQGEFEELARFSPLESLYRKFVFRKNRLVGAILTGKTMNRKVLKPQIKKAVLNMVDPGARKTDLLRDDFDFGSVSQE